MCGIAGFTTSAGNPDESLIRRMTATIVHRGPDQQGVYCSSGIALGAGSTAGHRSRWRRTARAVGARNRRAPDRHRQGLQRRDLQFPRTARRTRSAWSQVPTPIATPRWRSRAVYPVGYRLFSERLAGHVFRDGDLVGARPAAASWRATGWGSSRCMSGVSATIWSLALS